MEEKFENNVVIDGDDCGDCGFFGSAIGRISSYICNKYDAFINDEMERCEKCLRENIEGKGEELD